MARKQKGKDVEFVCRGNSRRSRLCESFARAYTDRYDIEGVAISSSGVNVGFLEGATAEDLVSRYSAHARMFRKAGFVSEEEDRDLRAGKNAEEIGRRLLDRILKYERRVRLDVLTELGLISYIDDEQRLGQRKPKRTIIRPEASLILPVSGGVKKEVVEIYSEASIQPHIELLTSFAGVKGDFSDISMDYQSLVESGKRMKEVVDKAMEKYLKIER